MADIEEADNVMEPVSSHGQPEWYSSGNQNEYQETAINVDNANGGNMVTSTTPPSLEGVHNENHKETSGSNEEPFDNFKSHLSKEMAGQLWQMGKQSTDKLLKTYAHIDILRPYFDVEPVQFRDRLLYSFIPNINVGAPQEAPVELYGPTMLVFTLVAVLLYGMKTSGHTVEDGTLIGTALVVCMSYWLSVGIFVFFMAYLLTAHLSLLQSLSLIGYSLVSHCVILTLSTLFDHYGMPSMFYIFWLTLGSLVSLKQGCVLISRSWTVKDGLILAGISCICHFVSVLYLRFAYHKVYEAVANVM